MHPFGYLLQQYMKRKRGLNLTQLAAATGQPGSVISLMSKGQRLSGPQARARVLAIIQWLHQQDVLHTIEEANALLRAAGMENLAQKQPDEARMLWELGGIEYARSLKTGHERRRTNLPEPLTSFIGRDRDMNMLKGMLLSSRLVTLTGAGGSGKSRLAMQTGKTLVNNYPYGVWLIELVPIANPDLLVQAVASVLRLRQQAEKSLHETLVEYLEQKRILLILDNCEHLIEACARLTADLLAACSQLQILATSREALRLDGEAILPVAPLAIPDRKDKAGLRIKQLLDYPAIRLFVDRAMAINPQLTVTNDNIWAIVEICQRLDGIPLAIELAAARANVMPVEEMAAEMANPLRILTGGNRAAPARHQTLRATIDWSYMLLTPLEQAVFRRLSVFAGTFSLNAAESICTEPGYDHDMIRDVLTGLAGKSLIVVAWKADTEQQIIPRYRLLEAIREYAFGRLKEADEIMQIYQRLLDWCSNFSNDLSTAYLNRTHDQLFWAKKIEEEYPNIRAALAWAEQSGGAAIQQALVIINTCWHYWEIRGLYSEIYASIVRILQHDIRDLALRAHTLLLAGTLLEYMGKYTEAEVFLEQSLAIAQAIGEQRTISTALGHQALLAGRRGDFIQQLSLYEQSLAIARATCDQEYIAGALGALAANHAARGDFGQAKQMAEEAFVIWRQLGNQQNSAAVLKQLWSIEYIRGDPVAGIRYLEESLLLYRAIGHRPGIASVLNNLGETARFQGDYAQARIYYEQSMAYVREIGNLLSTTSVLLNLADVALHDGDLKYAVTLFAEALQNAQELGMKQHISMGLAGFGGIASAVGQPHLAVQLLAASQSLYTSLGIVLPSTDRAAFERRLAAVRTQLAEEAFAVAWDVGYQMKVQEAISLAQRFRMLYEVSLPI